MPFVSALNDVHTINIALEMIYLICTPECRKVEKSKTLLDKTTASLVPSKLFENKQLPSTGS